LAAPSSDDDDPLVDDNSSVLDDEDINRNSTEGKCKEESSVALHSLRQLENLSSNFAG
jgi:hypothetical protein